MLIQVAASAQSCSHGLKIAGSNDVRICQRDVARARLRLAFRKDRVIGNIEGQRQAVDYPGSLNSRRGADLVEQALLKLASATLVVPLGGEIVGKDGGMLRVESKIRAERMLQAANHVYFPCYGDHRESHLRGDKNVAQVK